ncbi:hypothetical protein J3Q64DRAFT_1634583 [Phycomyces blakesleeanus]|uniref:UspA domain-containing protein n=1 Tax=Phycomyces blakesleeanus TaxID=4837 RepID=A0ABR3B884_PHYBL
MLAQEIEHLNRDTPEDRRVKEAVIMEKADPNKLRTDDDSDDNDEYEDDLAVRDPELFKITESNRQIIIEDMPAVEETKPGKQFRRPLELVFSEPPVTITETNRIIVTMTYGNSTVHTTKKSRKYLMAYDGGEESKYAMHWAMGTMLRSGDEVHVVGVINLEEDVDDMDEDEKKRLWQEMDRNSKTLISNVRTVLGDMLLYNIKIALYTIAGQTKEALLNVISETPLTMVVCGSRDRGSLKGMLMGSVSTFLVHNSPVPVSVVRPQKTEKKSKKKLTAAQKLSQSVRNGQLKVDEAEGAVPSINGHDGI